MKFAGGLVWNPSDHGSIKLSYVISYQGLLSYMDVIFIDNQDMEKQSPVNI